MHVFCGILPIQGCHRPRAIVGRKIFPFRIPWGLLKPHRYHVALVSIGLGPMYLESVLTRGTIRLLWGSIRHVISMSITSICCLFFDNPLIQYRQVHLIGSINLNFCPLHQLSQHSGIRACCNSTQALQYVISMGELRTNKKMSHEGE